MHANALATSRSIHAPAMLTSHSFVRPQLLTYFAAEAEIYAQGEQSGPLYRIEYGAVRIYRLLGDGRRQVVAFHLAGETFGFEAGRNHSFFAESMVQTGLRVLDRPTGDQSPDLMALALRGMIRAQEHLLVVGRQNAVERVAAFLLDMMERQGDLDQVELPMTRIDIGDYLGMTIETVSRNLAKLRKEGIIRIPTSRNIEIVKPAALRRLCA